MPQKQFFLANRKLPQSAADSKTVAWALSGSILADSGLTDSGDGERYVLKAYSKERAGCGARNAKVGFQCEGLAILFRCPRSIVCADTEALVNTL